MCWDQLDFTVPNLQLRVLALLCTVVLQLFCISWLFLFAAQR